MANYNISGTSLDLTVSLLHIFLDIEICTVFVLLGIIHCAEFSSGTKFIRLTNPVPYLEEEEFYFIIARTVDHDEQLEFWLPETILFKTLQSLHQKPRNISPTSQCATTNCISRSSSVPAPRKLSWKHPAKYSVGFLMNLTEKKYRFIFIQQLN